jgi:spermidine/putrescine transport system permease protein
MAVAEPGAVPGWTAVNGRWSTWLRRRDWARGYLLMSPTILVMVAMLIVPMIALVVISFWTQTVLEIDPTFTLENYWHLIEPSGEGDEVPTWLGIPFPLKRAVYINLLLKTILMSQSATVAVILLAYPMAYFLAFRVKRHKMIWLMAITLPFWTSYLLRVFSWKLMLGFGGVINSGLI